jgi:hypothetical protein
MGPGESRIRVSPASGVDAHRLSEFASRMFHETFAAENTPEDMAVYLSSAFSDARQLAEIDDPDTITLLAEDGTLLVGYAQLRASDHQPACLIAAASPRSLTVWLGVWERNTRAIAFYTKWALSMSAASSSCSGAIVRPTASCGGRTFDHRSRSWSD